MRVPVYQCQIVRQSTVSYDGRRALKNTQTACEVIKELVEPLLANSPNEQFLIITADTKLKPIGVHPITAGTLDASLIHPREVFRAAFLANASSIFAVHNHPSGDLTPSNQDVQVTGRLAESASILGISFIDHIIVGTDDNNVFQANSLRESLPHIW